MRLNNPICFHSYWLIKSHLNIVNFKRFSHSLGLSFSIISLHFHFCSQSTFRWIERIIFGFGLQTFETILFICCCHLMRFHSFLGEEWEQNAKLCEKLVHEKGKNQVVFTKMEGIKSLENHPCLFSTNRSEENTQYTNNAEMEQRFRLCVVNGIHYLLRCVCNWYFESF